MSDDLVEEWRRAQATMRRASSPCLTPAESMISTGDAMADEIERLQNKLADVETKLWAANEDCATQTERAEAAEAANHSVAVCADHTKEVIGEGCLVCDKDAAEAEVARLRQALIRYGRHEMMCRHLLPLANPPACDCGWDEALA